jgi:hypothetical protein
MLWEYASRSSFSSFTKLLVKKQKHKCLVLTEEKLNDTEGKLEHAPRKSLERLAQETRVSNSNARGATQLLMLRPYEIAVIHTLQPHDPASRANFCSWFLQSVIEGQLNLNCYDFFFRGCLKDKVYNNNPRMEEKLKENIRREIANIPAEQLQKVNHNLFHRCEECLHVVWGSIFNTSCDL